MKNYITPEFIELAKTIQNEIEPEVGMWFAGWNKEGHWDIELIAEESHVQICQECRASAILLPDLGWLVRKLREYGLPALEAETTGSPWWCGMFEDDPNSAAMVCGFDDTPELACLKALLKIKGVSDE